MVGFVVDSGDFELCEAHMMRQKPSARFETDSDTMISSCILRCRFKSTYINDMIHDTLLAMKDFRG